MEKKIDDVVNDNNDTNGISNINEKTPEAKNDDDNMNRGLLSSSNDDNNAKELYYSVIGSHNNGYNSSDDDDNDNDDDDNDSLTDHEPLDDDEFGEFNEYEPLNDDVLEEVADNAMSSLTIDYQRTINQISSTSNNNINTSTIINNQIIIEEELPIINEEDNNDNIDSVNDINITRKVVPPSIPPLNADKIDAIKLAMSKLNLTTRPGAEGICSKILQSKLRVGDEHL